MTTKKPRERHQPVDPEKLRVELRRMDRGNLLLVAERAGFGVLEQRLEHPESGTQDEV